MSLITLTTDFGLKDPFAGMMKGVIYSINSDVSIIDISHGIENQDVFEGAFIIFSSFNYFPAGSIHVVVVDPGVGSSRRPILARAHGHYFIGPDNGVLSLVMAGDNSSAVYRITAEQYFLRSAGNTFHGRDIFAPVAGWLSRGGDPLNFGSIITDYRRLDIPVPAIKEGFLYGEIVYIDKFGNLFTNISLLDIDDYCSGRDVSDLLVQVNSHVIRGMKRYYSDAGKGEIAVVVNSFGLLEIYAYMGNAAEVINLKKGDKVRLCLR